QIERFDAEVDRVAHDRRSHRHLSGDAHADRRGILRADAGDVGQFAYRGGDGGDHRLRAPARRPAHARHDLTVGRDGHRVGLGATDVQSETHQPFTAPETNPPVMRPWTMRKKIITGIAIMVDPAITAPQLTAPATDVD